MLVISQAQMDVFAGGEKARVEFNMLRALLARQPWAARAFSELALRTVTARGLERVRALELAGDEPALRYLELVLLLGCGWESDMLLAHVVKGLGDVPGEPAATALDAAWEAAGGWRESVIGEDRSLHRAALATLQGVDVEDLAKTPSRSQRDLMRQLAIMYPARYQKTPEQTIFDLTRSAVEACRPYALLDRWAVVLMVELMFLFGGRFLDDPLCEWANVALRDPQAVDVEKKLEGLLAAAQAAAAARC